MKSTTSGVHTIAQSKPKVNKEKPVKVYQIQKLRLSLTEKG